MARDEQEAREEHALKLAFATVRRFRASDPDELLSAALEGAALACVRFDPDRGATFATFALHYVRGSVMRALRDARPAGRKRKSPQEPLVSLDVPAEGAEEPLGEVIPDPRADTARTVLSGWERGEWRRLVAMLPAEWEVVVRRYHFEQERVEDIGRDLDLSNMGVYRRLYRAYGVLRKWAEAAGLAPEEKRAGEATTEARRRKAPQQQAPERGRAEAVR